MQALILRRKVFAAARKASYGIFPHSTYNLDFLNFCLFNGYFQLVTDPTRIDDNGTGNILDLIETRLFLNLVSLIETAYSPPAETQPSRNLSF